MHNKISRQLLNLVTTQGCAKQTDCIVYARDYERLGGCLNGLKVTQKFPFINAYGVKLSYKNIIDLARYDEVKYITQSVKVHTLVNVSKEIMNVSKESYFSPFSIAVIDTGIAPHIDIVGGYNPVVEWIDLINGRAKLYDDNGHGTFVTGVICGKGLLSNGKFSGMDENTNIVGIKALDEKGETSAGTILEAMQWVFDNLKKYNIRLVCMSFGSNLIDQNDPLIKGAERLWNSGVVVVCAAGNSGPERDTIKSPGASGKVITVGSLDDKREGEYYNIENFAVADFSSRGPAFDRFKPDVLAPGVDIVGLASFKVDKGHYIKMSGTSVSTPMIVAMCSRIIKQHPSYSPDMVKKILTTQTIKLNEDRNSQGYGWFRW